LADQLKSLNFQVEHISLPGLAYGRIFGGGPAAAGTPKL
jgi:hypothetical protein